MNVDLTSLAWSQFWQVAALGVLVGGVTVVACRRRPHLAYLLWMLVIAKALTPAAWTSPVGVFSLTGLGAATSPLGQRPPRSAAIETERSGNETPTAVADELSQDSTDVPAVSSLTLSRKPRELKRPVWPIVLGALWALGAISLSMAVATKWHCSYRQLRGSARKPDGEIASLFNQLRARLGISQEVELAITADWVGPVTVGVFRSTIFLPSALLRGKGPNRIEHILAHELVHVRRRDPLIGVVQFVAQVIWWFHPLVWLANREANRCRERCCDEETVAGLGCKPGDYARSLLDVLESKQQLVPVAVFPGIRSVEVTFKRLEHIMHTTQTFRRRTPRPYWLVLLAGLVIFLPGAAFVPQAPEAGASDSEAAVEEKDTGGNRSGSQPSGVEAKPQSGGAKGRTSVALGKTSEAIAKPAAVEEAVAALKELGARLEQNDQGQVTMVGLVSRHDREITDADLVGLRALGNIEKLYLTNTHTSGHALEYLREPKNLRTLCVGKRATDDGLERLRAMTNLRELSFSRERIDSQGRRVSYKQVGDATMRHLEGLKNLESLWLHRTDVTDVGLESLRTLTKIREMSLPPAATDKGLGHLAGLTNLERLNVGDTKITDAGLAHLKGFNKVWMLMVANVNVTDAGLAHLSGLTSIRRLTLEGTQITDAGLEHLTKLTKLEALGLSGTEITGAGLVHLQGFKDLWSLRLHDTDVDDSGLQHLKGLTSLQTVVLSGTHVTDEGVKKLQQALPNCQIRH